MTDKAIGHLVKLAITMITATLFSLGANAANVPVLHNFGGSPTDGAAPGGTLIIDKDGNLYGETEYRGARDGGGTVFRLSRKEDGKWTETVLHSFGTGYDGEWPAGGLVLDASGNLYGVTVFGGAKGNGTVFELSPAEGGKWTEKVLHSFDEASQGIYPFAALIFDSAGNLYGTTQEGGPTGDGTVFELSPAEGGKWTERVIHSFDMKTDGQYPQAALVLDADGNLYGTTSEGGPNHAGPETVGGGTVFELTPGADAWTETTLHAFSGDNINDGQSPSSGVVLDAAGNLYGTTAVGGTHFSGTIFELIREEGGT